MGEVTSYPAPDVGTDTVLQQTPSSGTRATSARVDLLVAQSETPPAYVMPWLVGMPQTDAERKLSASAIKLAKTTILPSPEWPKGTVIEQTPAQGSKITRESSIELVVAQ
jgi:beta-lactam-binding protein with PASTA domain